MKIKVLALAAASLLAITPATAGWTKPVYGSWGYDPSAMDATKTLFYKLDTLGFLDGISAGIVANADARSTPAFREGVKRFTSRKKDKP